MFFLLLMYLVGVNAPEINSHRHILPLMQYIFRPFAHLHLAGFAMNATFVFTIRAFKNQPLAFTNCFAMVLIEFLFPVKIKRC